MQGMQPIRDALPLPDGRKRTGQRRQANESSPPPRRAILSEADKRTALKAMKQAPYKAMALEMGMEPHPDHPGYYRHPDREFVYTAQGGMAGEEDVAACKLCHGASFVLIYPIAPRYPGQMIMAICECAKEEAR